MKTTEASMNYLKDFTDLDFSTPEMFMTFKIGKTDTHVTTEYKVLRHSKGKPLFLNGVNLDFKSLKINGNEWSFGDYEETEEGLLINTLPNSDEFKLTVENVVHPNTNTQLEGLYLSGDMLCTQNEPMGFRKITYSIDRPDNMVKCKVKIVGDEKEFPFMLSNGNLIDEGSEGGVRYCTWQDPFPKSLHLFALVAGDLAEIKDEYTTGSGRKIDIRFYCDKGAEDKCDFAVESLKKSMKWDEERFGLEYDLDLYMVVAVDSFNMGAMENKGLNIFNSALVLANPQTATDLNYHRIESVIGHEYFHNWTGNRVTLKNWFQLTLKEGLTVFRDQEFSSDLNDAAVERIGMVKSLKERQFSEDAGALAHPIRPEKYKEMNNFYTATVYEKGAEVIRMLHTLLGEEKFQLGMKEYFKLYDGKAITTEDFVNVMTKQDSRIDKACFLRWYQTPGTPRVEITEKYKEGVLTLKFEQSNPIAKQQSLGFEETYIPIRMSIYEKDGLPTVLRSVAPDQPFLENGIVLLKEKETEIEFKIPSGDYVCSYLEDFSAPVLLKINSETRDLSKLVKYDRDNFNRYNAFKKSAVEYANGKSETHLDSVSFIFKDGQMTELMKSQILEPPTLGDFVAGKNAFDPSKVLKLKSEYVAKVGNSMGDVFINYLNENPLSAFKYNLKDKGKRALQVCLLGYVLASAKYKKEGVEIAKRMYKDADNMTIAFGVLQLLQEHVHNEADKISDDFYNKNKDNQLTLQKWIGAYLAVPSLEEAEKRIAKVEALEGYSDKVPNFVRALWGSFFRNEVVFHDSKGRGYELLLNAIAKVDKINPQMSSGLMKVFNVSSALEGVNRDVVELKLKAFGDNNQKLSKNLSETYGSILGGLK
jgi:aminopeptidase N